MCHSGTVLSRSLMADAGASNHGMNNEIALVDDDRNILTSVSIALQAEGTEVEFRKVELEKLESAE